LRRVVDLSAGYDPSGIMLVGPLLAVLMSAPELLRLLRPGSGIDRTVLPAVTVAGCVLYATMLSMFQGDFQNAATGSVKWFAPLIYALALMLRGERGLAQAAARVFQIILPVAGLYAIYQYVALPDWDRFWMQYTTILSIGQPEPYAVRVFGTMNSPASFATIVSAGLLLVGFLRPGWQGLVLMLPAALGVLLSSYRTAWLSLVAGMVFCLLFRSTRTRAGGAMGGMAGALIVAGTLTPFGEMITGRLETLGHGTQDDSWLERMGEYTTLWDLPDSGLIGSGYTITDVGTAGAMPIDGTIIACWVTMGIVFGLICLVALLAAAGQAIWVARRTGTREAVVLGGLAVGALVQLPLSGISSGELGFLFWTFVALSWLELRAHPA